MKNFIILLLTILFISNLDGQTPYFDWALNSTGPDTERTLDVAADEFGNSYSVAFINGDTELRGDEHINMGFYDILLAKFDPDGQLVWSQLLGGTNLDIAYGIETDSQGNLYMVGSTNGFCSLGQTNGNDIFINLGSTSFVVKYAPDGEVIWVNTMDGPSNTGAYDVAIDQNDDVFITGFFIGEQIDMLSQDGRIESFSGSGSNGDNQWSVFNVHYNSLGYLQKAWTIPSSKVVNSNGIDVSSDGDVTIIGEFSEYLFIDEDTLKSEGTGNIFIAQYSHQGELNWYKNIGSRSTFTSRADVGVDLSYDTDDKIVITGYFMDTMMIDQYELISVHFQDVFMAKLDNDGQTIWAKSFQGYDQHDNPGEVVIDQYNHIYVSGHFNTALTVDGQRMFSNGRDDVFVVKLDDNGKLVWMKHCGGTSKDQGGYLALSENGDLFVGGWISGNTADFDDISLTSTGGSWYDLFHAKIPNVATSTKSVDILEARIYPNPAQDFIKINNDYLEFYSIENMNGQTVQNGNMAKEIQLKGLAPGTYVLTVTNKNQERFSTKLVIAP